MEQRYSGLHSATGLHRARPTGSGTQRCVATIAVAMKKCTHEDRLQLEANGTDQWKQRTVFLAAGLSSSSNHCHWTGLVSIAQLQDTPISRLPVFQNVVLFKVSLIIMEL